MGLPFMRRWRVAGVMDMGEVDSKDESCFLELACKSVSVSLVAGLMQVAAQVCCLGN